MKKWKKLLMAVLPLTLTMAFTSLAGEWKQDDAGWWYQNDDGSYYNDGWHWIDGDGDGTAECYFFGFDGYIAKGPAQVDGSWINEDGAWISEDGVQHKQVGTTPAESGNPTETGERDAYAVYRDSVLKSNTLDSMEVNYKFDMTMEAEGESLTATMNTNMKMKGVQSGNVQFLMNGNMNLLDFDIPVTMFYADGYYYMDMMGQKVKTPMPIDQALEEANSSVVSTDVDMSSVRDLTMSTEGEYTVLNYSVDLDEMTSMLNEVIGGVLLGSDLEYQINAINCKTYIDKNGYNVKDEMYIGMDMTMEGQTVHVKANAVVDFNHPGQPVDFAIPSTEGYVESSSL